MPWKSIFFRPHSLALIFFAVLFSASKAQDDVIVSKKFFKPWDNYELQHFEASFKKPFHPFRTKTFIMNYEDATHLTAFKVESIDTTFDISENISLIKSIWKETMFWKNGHIRHIRFFEDESPVGIWKYWDISGNLKYTYHHTGRNNCIIRHYYPMGKLHSLIHLDEISNISEATYFFENGVKQRSGKKLKLKNPGRLAIIPVKIGLWKYWHINGQLMQKGNFLKGKKHGVWKFYNRQGKLMKRTKYINGEIVKQSLFDN